MLIENEIKLRLTGPEHTQRVLGECRSRYTLVSDWCMQHDAYYDTPEGFLREDDLTLRVRELPQAAHVAVKGPRKRRDSGEYYRFEIEIPVSDAPAIKAMLAEHGFSAQVTIEKRRIEFAKGAGTRISIDQLPYMGHFIEIEGPSLSIRKVLAELGLQRAEAVRENYTELLEHHLGARCAPPGTGLVAIFPEDSA